MNKIFFKKWLAVLGSVFLSSSLFIASADNQSELNQAYDYAYKYWITTMDSIDKANMQWWLNRISMAKMLSQYAINVLWSKPANIAVPEFSDVEESLDNQYNYWVSLSYQLGIMWIGVKDFRPYDTVTRAEFATALSRMLYWLKDWTPYYSTHLTKLKEEGIISNDDPDLEELRGYVMLMLMRSAKDTKENVKDTQVETWDVKDEKKEEDKKETTTWIANPASTYCVENWWEIIIKTDKDWGQYWVCKLKDWTEVEEREYYRANLKAETITWNDSLVIVFSPTGHTKEIATSISEIKSLKLEEIQPLTWYTAEDINWNDQNSRSYKEYQDETIRPEIKNEFALSWYDTIYLWYPIWFGRVPNIIMTFLEKYDLSGKKVVLFCTSWSSGIEWSVSYLEKYKLNVIWSKRFAQWASKDEVKQWLETL